MMRISRLAFAAAALALCGSAHATEFVKNGDFSANNGPGQLGYNTSAAYWTTQFPNYTFLFQNGTAGANGEWGNVALWDDGNGANNGWNGTGRSAFFVGMDGDYQTTALTQQINNLATGQKYTLTFDYAFGQQQYNNGPTSQQWLFRLGEQSGATAVFIVADEGFTGWRKQSYTFTASSGSELLSFIASASPAVPPFALLSNVSLTGTPSAPSPGPATGPLAVLGLLALGYARRRRGQADQNS